MYEASETTVCAGNGMPQALKILDMIDVCDADAGKSQETGSPVRA
ncbi:MAG: hypothetical protein ACLRQA_07250 [Anaerovoracaceae bacterium]